MPVFAGTAVNPGSGFSGAAWQDPATPPDQPAATPQEPAAQEPAAQEPAAQEPAANATPATPQIEIETIAEGLYNPAGIAIQPGTNHVFVADSGNLRVIRLVDGKVEDVITGFDKGTFVEGQPFEIGPLGLAFLDAETLVVGGGGKAAGEDLLMVFKIPAPGSPALNAESDRQFAESLPAEGDMVGEGNFFGVATTPTAVYLTCNGDDAKGWVARSDRTDAELTGLKRMIATRELTGTAGPMGLAITPAGFLAVGQMGTKDQPGDSKLSFFNDKGEKLSSYGTGLNDIVALAYSPLRKRLFALDLNFANPAEGGLYKLVRIRERNDQCEARKVEGLKLVLPTALAFDAEGNLYITQCGMPGKEGDAKPGSVIRIKGLDVEPPKPEGATGNEEN